MDLSCMCVSVLKEERAGVDNDKRKRVEHVFLCISIHRQWHHTSFMTHSFIAHPTVIPSSSALSLILV